MNTPRLHSTAAIFLSCGLTAWLAPPTVAQQSPTPDIALKFTPIQQFVDYEKPTADEIRQCTIRAEKEGNTTAWVVRNGQGAVLRRFADTNNDNKVDQWCYYDAGLEVYRDIDSNFNESADQYRWFHTAGSRWGLDKDENKKIDEWRMISPHEVAEQVVIALRTRDVGRFNVLLLTPAELAQLGLGKQLADRIAGTVQAASSGFAKLAAQQNIVTPQSVFVDFGSARPAAIPAGTGGSTKDVVICDSATALVQVGGKHEQVYLGTLVQVGNTWKLIDLPSVGPDQQSPSPFLMAQDAPAERGAASPNAPSEEMQKLLAELEQLDKATDGLAPAQFAANVEQRGEKLNQLVEATTEAELKSQWYRQLIDMYFVAVQSGNFPQGVERLEQLEKRLKDAGAGEELLSHATFQKMWAANAVAQSQPGAETAKLQEKWLADLEAFVTAHPKSADSAEALLQLGMFQEFNGKTAEARKWYSQLVRDFPTAAPAKKASGAVWRLASVGQPMQLRGQSLQKDGNVDLGAYRGKVVLIQCWATWAQRSTADMILLKDFYAKNAGRGFDIIGINLDDQAAPAQQFLAQNRLPWKQLHEPGGVDGPLANRLGVMTVPLMILVDEKGNVVNDNIQVAELDAELNKLSGKREADANALRPAANPQR